MKVRVEYPSPMHIAGTASGSAVDVAPGTTIAGLLDQLGVPPRHQDHVAAFINEARVHRHHVLSDGDRVLLQVPISGG